ncbi:MAG TPA: peroxiredoxin-like family protein [Geminicoccaceae bacterium]|nr:peroxiredoxin-like family protein [Geminicoccus sp.]HMU49982.1 peroxiredoxin-like family protein [Geminicoccaceae bacterium]
MSLRDELAKRREALRNGVIESDRRLVGRSIERNWMLQLAEHGLAVGDMLPDFALSDATGRQITSDELLDGRPLVVAFFRGGWCPYCDAALRALEAARPRIETAGAKLVGISPETPKELARTASQRQLGFLLLSDSDSSYARLCGVGYEEAQAVKGIYRRLDIDFRDRDTEAAWLLPLPVTYVIGGNGRIEWVFVDPDWSYRAEPEELVEAVTVLAREGVNAISTNALTGGE